MFCTSFIVLTVKARLFGLDPAPEKAAMDLSANELQTFRKVTLPRAMPGIVAAALVAFSLSFEDRPLRRPRRADQGLASHRPEGLVMRVSVVLDCADPAALVEFWSAALRYRLVGELPGYRVLRPEEGEPPGPVLILQQVPEPKVGKNRAHVDVHPPPGTAERHVARLEALGGRRLGDWVVEIPGIRWMVLQDPQGNELCVVDDDYRPGAAT